MLRLARNALVLIAMGLAIAGCASHKKVAKQDPFAGTGSPIYPGNGPVPWGDCLHARGDIRFAEKNADAMAVDNQFAHGAAFEPISSARANRILRLRAVSGGDASRVTKLVVSPGFKGRTSVSRVQE